jgi:WD40 repeat protein
MAMQATLTTTIPAPGFLFDVAFSPDGRWLALATSRRRVPVVEVATGRKRLAVRHGSWRGGGAMGVAFSPDGHWLATAGVWDHAARIWDAATGKQLRKIPHEFVDNPGAGYPKVQAVAFSPDSRLLATGSADCTGRIFEVASGQELLRVTNCPGVNDVVFSPDGRWFAGSGRTTRIWDVTSGEELLGVSSDWCSEVAFSPDGRLLATTGGEKAVRLWDTASGAEVVAFSHDGPTWDVAFGPDGRWLAVGGGDTARVWDAQSGEELLVVHDEASPEGIGFMSVAISADGRLLATSGRSGRRGLDHLVRVWQLQENPMDAPASPGTPGDAALARVRGRVDVASQRSGSVEVPVGAVRVSQRTRRLKERLRAAAVGRLGQGEELLVVTYAQHDRSPAIIWRAGVVLAFWCFALGIVRAPLPLIVASLCVFVLLLAFVLIRRKWLGVVLTDRRLLLWSTARVTRQLRGVLLEVPRGQVSMQHTSVLRIDGTVGDAPISLMFRGEFAPDEVILQRALASSEG